jgi:hypothetical protein
MITKPHQHNIDVAHPLMMDSLLEVSMHLNRKMVIGVVAESGSISRTLRTDQSTITNPVEGVKKRRRLIRRLG